MTGPGSTLTLQQVPTPARRACTSFASIGLLLFFLLRIEALAALSCLVLAFLWTSSFLARHAASNLLITIEAPRQRIRAGERLTARVTLRNRGWLLPVVHPCLDISTLGRAHPQSVHYAGTVPPRRSVTFAIHPVASHRGPQSLAIYRWRTLFPFALHETTAQTQHASEPFIVWPAATKLNLASLLRRSNPALRQSESFRPLRRHAADPGQTFLRDYQAGDSRRSINWKLSAKLDKLLVLEAHPTQRRRLALRLDTTAALWQSAPRFEGMLRLAAALAVQLAQDDALQAFFLNGRRYRFPNRSDLPAFLDALSSCTPLPAPPPYPESPPAHTLLLLPDGSGGITLKPATPAEAVP